jgi:hypothetical protein
MFPTNADPVRLAVRRELDVLDRQMTADGARPSEIWIEVRALLEARGMLRFVKRLS